jgi:hypothetical protein
MPYSSADRMRSVSQRLEVFHPTIRRKNRSRTAASQNAGDAGGVGDPEPVRAIRDELPVDEVRRRRVSWVLLDGATPDP